MSDDDDEGGSDTYLNAYDAYAAYVGFTSDSEPEPEVFAAMQGYEESLRNHRLWLTERLRGGSEEEDGEPEPEPELSKKAKKKAKAEAKKAAAEAKKAAKKRKAGKGAPDDGEEGEIDNPVSADAAGADEEEQVRELISMQTVKIPIYQFQRKGLVKAAETLQDKIDQLNPATESNQAVIQRSAAVNFAAKEILVTTSDVRDLFDEMCQDFVLAHAALAIYPEIDRRVKAATQKQKDAADAAAAKAAKKKGGGSVETPDVSDMSDLSDRVKAEAAKMLREGTHREINTAYNQLGHSLIIPGMKVESEAGSHDLIFGECLVCGNELRIYDETHPAWSTIGDVNDYLEGWDCDVCDQAFSGPGQPKSALFCCDSFTICDWSACQTCQFHARDNLGAVADLENGDLPSEDEDEDGFDNSLAIGAAGAAGAAGAMHVFSKKELKQIKQDEVEAEKEVQAQFKAEALEEQKQAKATALEEKKQAKIAKKAQKGKKGKGKAGKGEGAADQHNESTLYPVDESVAYVAPAGLADDQETKQAKKSKKAKKSQKKKGKAGKGEDDVELSAAYENPLGDASTLYPVAELGADSDQKASKKKGKEKKGKRKADPPEEIFSDDPPLSSRDAFDTSRSRSPTKKEKKAMAKAEKKPKSKGKKVTNPLAMDLEME